MLTDFDNDGTSDLFFLNPLDFTMNYLPNRGDGSFAPDQWTTSSNVPLDVSIAGRLIGKAPADYRFFQVGLFDTDSAPDILVTRVFDSFLFPSIGSSGHYVAVCPAIGCFTLECVRAALVDLDPRATLLVLPGGRYTGCLANPIVISRVHLTIQAAPDSAVVLDALANCSGVRALRRPFLSVTGTISRPVRLSLVGITLVGFGGDLSSAITVSGHAQLAMTDVRVVNCSSTRAGGFLSMAVADTTGSRVSINR